MSFACKILLLLLLLEVLRVIVVSMTDVAEEAPHQEASPAELEYVAFMHRMRASRRCFYIKATGSTTVEAINANFFDDDEDAVEFYKENEITSAGLSDAKAEEIKKANSLHRKKWIDCCRAEHVHRRRAFLSRFPTTAALYRTMLYAVIVLAVVLWWFWPLWDVLIDVEAEDHYKILGLQNGATPAEVKKAYRAKAKQWHPDLNPDCGQRCRDMMIQLQAAHDVLLARGDRSEELANKYQEALHQIRSLLAFRMYSISFFAAEFVNTLLLASVASLKPYKAVIRRATRTTAVALFMALEVIHVTGLNPIIFLQMFYFCATVIRQSAALTDLQKVSKWSYVDIKRDALCVVLPAVVLHTVYYWTFGASIPELSKYLWHLCVGAGYLCSHLSRFTPNLYDNLALRKCGVALDYTKKPELTFSMPAFIWAELGVLVDDLFAFSSHVPSVYRLIVLFVHGVYLTQLYVLPRDDPLKGKLQRQFEESNEKVSTKRKKVRATASSTGEENAAVPLTEREFMFFANVDSEECIWLDLPHRKIIHAIQQATVAARKKSPESNAVQATTLVTPDLKEILVCTVLPGPNGAPNISVHDKIRDESCASVVAREGGMNSVLWGWTGSGVKQVPMTPDMARTRFNALLAFHPDKMLSTLHRLRLRESNQPGPHLPVHELLGLLCVLMMLIAAVPYSSLSLLQSDSINAATLFDPLGVPSSPSRFYHSLAENHLLNRGAGLLRAIGPLALVGPDMVDGLRQMSLYQTKEDERAAGAMSAKGSKGKPQQKPNPKSQPRQDRQSNARARQR